MHLDADAIVFLYILSTGYSRDWSPWESHCCGMVHMPGVACTMVYMPLVAFPTQAHFTFIDLISVRMGGARIVQRKLGGQLLSPTRQGGACQALRMAARSLCAGSGGNSREASA